MFTHGVGVPTDANKGLKHLEIAAERGIGEAVELLQRSSKS